MAIVVLGSQSRLVDSFSKLASGLLGFLDDLDSRGIGRGDNSLIYRLVMEVLHLDSDNTTLVLKLLSTQITKRTLGA